MWLIVRAGGAPHLFDLGDVEAPTNVQVAAARVLVDFPPGNDFWTGPDREFIPNQLPDPVVGRENVPAFDVSTQDDPLHPDLLAIGTVHELAELSHVDETKVADYLAGHEKTVQAERRAALLAELGRLDPEELAALLDEHAARQ